MDEALDAALSLTSMRASVVSEHVTSVLHWETTLQYSSWRGRQSEMTWCSHRRHMVVGAFPSAEWTMRAVRWATVVYEP